VLASAGGSAASSAADSPAVTRGGARAAPRTPPRPPRPPPRAAAIGCPPPSTPLSTAATLLSRGARVRAGGATAALPPSCGAPSAGASGCGGRRPRPLPSPRGGRPRPRPCPPRPLVSVIPPSTAPGASILAAAFAYARLLRAPSHRGPGLESLGRASCERGCRARESALSFQVVTMKVAQKLRWFAFCSCVERKRGRNPRRSFSPGTESADLPESDFPRTASTSSRRLHAIRK
jgi:hypothetical protein